MKKFAFRSVRCTYIRPMISARSSLYNHSYQGKICSILITSFNKSLTVQNESVQIFQLFGPFNKTEQNVRLKNVPVL